MVEAITRRIWGWLLWFSRRPWIKRMQRRSIDWAPAGRRDQARRALRWQNLVGLRYGRMIVRVSVILVLLSIGFTASFLIVIEMANRGVFSIPR